MNVEDETAKRDSGTGADLARQDLRASPSGQRDRAGAPSAGIARNADEATAPAAGADEGNGGEDDGSTEKEGDDSHLHDDQKAPSL